MNLSDITEQAKADLRRDLALGRATEEIKRAEEDLAKFPPMFCGARSTERALAFGNLTRWMAYKMKIERGLVSL